jgi:uncharacterized SAM-binding protein YcdF (DUF218 family)
VTGSYIISSFVLPPTSLVLLALVGVLLWRVRPRAALVVIAVSQSALLAFAMPVVARALAGPLEPPPLALDALKGAQAVVILGGGVNRSAVEWGGETVNDFTLQRLRYGALLARSSGLPVYVTGGTPPGARFPEGKLMADVLARDYGVAVRWIDNAAETTRGNAVMTARDLKPLGIQRVALVTTAIHMPRSQRAFEAAGLSVIPAPTDYVAQRSFTPSHLIPGAGALYVSHYALREWISRAYYALIGS